MYNFMKVLSYLVWEEGFPYSLENIRFKPMIAHIETIKVISVFAGSFSPLLTFMKSSGFSLEYQDISEC